MKILAVLMILIVHTSAFAAKGTCWCIGCCPSSQGDAKPSPTGCSPLKKAQ